jgi:plastocyanin
MSATRWSRILLLPTLMGASPRSSVPEVAVAIQLFQFQPKSLEVPVGSRVTWTNADQIEHTVTSGNGERADGQFAGVVAGKGTSFTQQFDQPGVYAYYCDRHHFMRGEIRVVPGKAGN